MGWGLVVAQPRALLLMSAQVSSATVWTRPPGNAASLSASLFFPRCPSRFPRQVGCQQDTHPLGQADKSRFLIQTSRINSALPSHRLAEPDRIAVHCDCGFEVVWKVSQGPRLSPPQLKRSQELGRGSDLPLRWILATECSVNLHRVKEKRLPVIALNFEAANFTATLKNLKNKSLLPS